MKKLLLVLVLVSLFAVFVWPTRYQQFEPGEGPYTIQAPDAATRIDRITGDIALLDPSGQWTVIGNERKALAFQRPDVDPNAMHRQKGNPNQQAVDERRHAVQHTQQAVDAATQAN